jgi:uncharacterized membrane protein
MEPQAPRLSVRIGHALRRYFVVGLATLMPAVVTIGLVFWLDGWLGAQFHIQIPGLGLLATFVVTILVGIFTVHFFGRVVFKTLEVWLTRLPVIRRIYPTVKQFTDFLFGEQKGPAAFRRVVLVQYPRPNCYAIAFVTNETQTTVLGQHEMLLTLLVPNPPSPLSGPVLFVPASEVIPLNMTVEQALKLIISGGVVGAPLQMAEPAT